MNILYISCVDGAPWAGPTYSVPNQVKAQTRLDYVLWYNFYDGSHPEWVSAEWEKLPYYCDFRDYPNARIADLPAPFNHPDLVVVEQFYTYAKQTLPWELMKRNIPYIIVPRGELTSSAQKRKSLKKRIFNAVYYRRFAQKAAAIQYLTEQEKTDSGAKWNSRGIVIPNGVNLPDKTKTGFHGNGIKAVVIGRIEPYQKGLDILIDACESSKQEILDAGMTIEIYGPDRVGRLEEMKTMAEQKGLNGVIGFHDAVYGEDKERVLLDADVFIIPSRFEGHPTALIEALAYGIPALATTGANMRPEIERHDAGWGCDADSGDLSKAIGRMISEKDDFQKKSDNAKRLAHDYSWNYLAEQSHEKYTQLIGDTQQKPACER